MLRPKLLLPFLTLLALSGQALAQGPSVAIVAAAQTTTTDCRFTDPQAKLLATGQFSTVDVINAAIGTPTLIDLAVYDSIIVWSNADFADSVALGDVLADYVDAGGGVVVATFANSEASANRSLQGRWLTGYEVIVAQGGSAFGPQQFLGTVLVPTHPLMQGVSSFDGGSSSFRPSSTALTAGSTLIAEWTDGAVLVAAGANATRVDLGMYPPSSDCSSSFWVSSTDGAQLMANALVYTSSGGPGTAYCFGDGTGGACPCGNTGGSEEGCANSTGAGAKLAATGSARIASANLVLSTIQVQPNQPGLYFQGLNAVNGGNGLIFGDGLRCAGGGIVRLQVVTANATGVATSTVDIVAQGGVTAGDVRRYQYWYRNPNVPQGSPCGSAFNLSNGLEINWLP